MSCRQQEIGILLATLPDMSYRQSVGLSSRNLAAKGFALGLAMALPNRHFFVSCIIEFISASGGGGCDRRQSYTRFWHQKQNLYEAANSDRQHIPNPIDLPNTQVYDWNA